VKKGCGDMILNRGSESRLRKQGLWRLKSLILTLVLSLAIIGIPLAAGPNLSGKWKLNRTVSTLGRLADSGVLFGPSELIQTIDHQGANLRISLYQAGGPGEIRAQLAYVTDGSECLNHLADTEVKSTVQWNDSVLVIRSHLEAYSIQFEDSWVVSADGKTLTIKRRVTGPSAGGEESQTLVLERQD